MKSKKVFEYFHKIYPQYRSARRATAHALGLTDQAIYKWGEEVPYHSQLLIELYTDGKFKAKKQEAVK